MLYCVFTSQVKSPSITICTPLSSPTSPSPFPSDNHHTIVCVCEFSFSLIPSPLHPALQSLSPLTAISVFSMSLFCFLVYFDH